MFRLDCFRDGMFGETMNGDVFVVMKDRLIFQKGHAVLLEGYNPDFTHASGRAALTIKKVVSSDCFSFGSYLRGAYDRIHYWRECDIRFYVLAYSLEDIRDASNCEIIWTDEATPFSEFAEARGLEYNKYPAGCIRIRGNVVTLLFPEHLRSGNLQKLILSETGVGKMRGARFTEVDIDGTIPSVINLPEEDNS